MVTLLNHIYLALEPPEKPVVCLEDLFGSASRGRVGLATATRSPVVEETG